MDSKQPRARAASLERELAALRATNADMTIRFEETRRVLASELNHRVRNMLQIVIGLARQSLRRAQDLEAFEQGFFGRMQALAQAYDLLSREGWRSVPMDELFHSQLSACAAGRHRYSVRGDHLLLAAPAALSLGLIVCELAMNASKHGALSVPAGHVYVAWSVRDRDEGTQELVLVWEERGGPRVEAPRRHGFGADLLNRQLKHELNGIAALDFAEQGLTVKLSVPADGVIARAAD